MQKDKSEIAFEIGKAHQMIKKAEKIFADQDMHTEHSYDLFVQLYAICDMRITKMKD